MMDAKERLRLYLEQRRDAGESELVLDSLSVEDVMRLLGAGSVARPAASSSAATSDSSSPKRSVAPVERGSEGASVAAADRPVDSRGDDPPAGDWRSALRALDPPPREEARARPSLESPPRPPLPRTDAERAPAPAPRAPGSRDVAPPSLEPVTHASAMMASPDDASRDTSHATMPLDHVPVGVIVGSPAHELFGGPQSPYTTLDALAQATQGCQLCALYKTAKQAVPGEGDPNADFVCVGEAPGANEDEQGRPFIGQAGQLLTKILGAIDLAREQVFICNVLKHRPPGNRNPTPDEVSACSPYLVRQIELIKPTVILALGTFAAQTLLQTKEPIGRLRGKIHRYYGVPLIVTYHPAALLRNPSWKRPTWEDVQLARRILDRARGA